MKEIGGRWEVSERKMIYRSLLREELNSYLKDAGFEKIKWHMPDCTGYHQPIVTAIKSL